MRQGLKGLSSARRHQFVFKSLIFLFNAKVLFKSIPPLKCTVDVIYDHIAYFFMCKIDIFLVTNS